MSKSSGTIFPSRAEHRYERAEMRLTDTQTPRRHLRRLWADEHGQSLVIVSIAMLVMLGISALAIDVSSWYVKHHQAQVVADSAALAAANCLANSGHASGLGPVCASDTDVTDAQQVAVAYAARNGFTIPTAAVSVDTSTDRVEVTATTTAPAFFANLFGIHSATETAGAAAGWKVTGAAPCTTSSTAQSQGECYAIYAQNQTCGSNNGWVAASTSMNITGAIHSQGSLNISNGSFSFDGPITYSSGNCTYTPHQTATLSSSSGPPQPGGNEPADYWPVNYAAVFPPCSSTGADPCTTIDGIAGVPSYCTQATESASGFTFGEINDNDEQPIAGNVYCAIGSGNASDPSTWNGPVTFSQGGEIGSSGDPLDATYIGGYVSAGRIAMNLAPAPNTNNCLFYMTDRDSSAGGNGAAIDLQNGAYVLSGTMFAPNGTISLSSTSTKITSNAFLEAQNVNTSNLSFTGDGPLVTSSGTPVMTGADTLTQ